MEKSVIGALVLVSLFWVPYLQNEVAAADLTAPPPTTNLKINGGSTGGGGQTVTCPSAMILSPSVPVMKQEGWNLCWAATAQMSMAYYQQAVPQCQEAADSFGKSTCCTRNPLFGSDCDQIGWPWFSKYNFHAVVGKITQWSEVVHYICELRSPFLYTYEIPGGGDAHIRVVHGYDKTANQVYSIDPGDPLGGAFQEPMNFDLFFTWGSGPWWDHTQIFRDFMDICPLTAVKNGACTPKP